MGSYAIPNNKLKGEGRILLIFTTKSLIYTAIGALLGTPIYVILSILGQKTIGMILIALMAILGYLVATVKFPSTTGKVGRYLAGDTVDEIIIKYIKFRKSRKTYRRKREVTKTVKRTWFVRKKNKELGGEYE